MRNKSSKAFTKYIKINRKRAFFYKCRRANDYNLLVNILLLRMFQVGQLTPIMREVLVLNFWLVPFKAAKQAGTQLNVQPA